MARRADGKMDRRTSEYKEAAARMKKARAAAARQRTKPAKSVAGRRADGRLDQRTKQGKEMADRMAALRSKRGKGFFNWLFGG